MISRVNRTGPELSRKYAIEAVRPLDRSAGRRNETGPDADGGAAGNLPAPVTGSGRGRTYHQTDSYALPQAPLVAQLLAAYMDLPQTRILRRASADVADAAYRRTERLDPEPSTSRITSL